MATTLINSLSPPTKPSSVNHARRSLVSVRLHSFPRKMSKSETTHLKFSPSDSVFELFPNEKDDDSPLHQVFWRFEYMVGRGYKPDPNQAAVMLTDLCRCRKFEKAAKAIELMIGLGCSVHSHCYNITVDGLGSNEHVSTAVSLVAKLEDNRFSTNPATYNALIRGCFLRGSFKQGLLVMNWLFQRGFIPNSSTYSILLDAVSKNCGFDEAMRLLGYIVSKGKRPEVSSYNSLLSGLCRENRVDEAILFVKDWPSMGLTPDESTYIILVKTFCREGRWEEVNELVPKMVACLPTTCIARIYNMLVGLLGRHGRIDDALRLIDEMLRKGFKPNATNYNPIILHLCKQRKVDDAVKCLDLMVSHGCKPQVGTYNAIAVLCEQGMVQEAFSIFESFSTRKNVLNSSRVDDFYNNVLLALCRERNTYPAFQLLYEMTKCGFTPSSYTYSHLLIGLCREGLANVALRIFRIMEESGYMATLDNYNALIYGLCVCRKTDLGLEVFNMMIEKGCMPDEHTYKNIVQGIVYEKEKELASLVLKELHSRQLVGEKLVERIVWQYDLEDFFR